MPTRVLDSYYLKATRPDTLVQYLLCCARFNVRNGIVTGPTLCQRVSTIVLLAFLFYSHVHAVTIFFVKDKTVQGPLVSLGAVMDLIKTIAYTSNLITMRFFDNGLGINLFLKVHDSLRVLKLHRNKTIVRMMYKTGSVTVYMVIITILNVVIFLTQDVSLILMILFHVWGFGVLGVDLSYGCHVLINLLMEARYLNAFLEIELSPGGRVPLKKCFHFYPGYPCEYIMKRIAMKQNIKFKDTEANLWLHEICGCLKAFQDCYKLQVGLHLGFSMMWMVLALEYMILFLKNNFQYTLGEHFMTVLIWVLINFVTLFGLCIHYDLLLKELKKTKMLSLSILARNLEGPTRTKAKSMFKIIESFPTQFCIYNVVIVDARLLLQIVNVTASTLFTLLQFAYL